MTDRKKSEREELSALAAVGPFLGYGLTFAMAAGLFFFLGWTLDGWLGTTPILAVIGAFVGAGGGFYYIVQNVALTSTSGSRSESEGHDPPGGR